MTAQIGLYKKSHLGSPFSLEFRGDDIRQVNKPFDEAEVTFEEPKTVMPDGDGSASVFELGGHGLIFETSEEELSPWT